MLNEVVLGAIQGVSEFLPVSSTAHLMMFSRLMNFQNYGREFDIFLNFGTLLAVILFFRFEFIKLVAGFVDFVFGKKTENKEFFITIFLSSLPTIVVGILVDIMFKVDVQSINILLPSIIIFAIIMYICDQMKSDKHDVSRRDSVLIGVAQTLAIVPGVSRLGVCLSMMRMLNYRRDVSFRYAMFLSIPPVSGACFLKLMKVVVSENASIDIIAVSIGCISSFVFGIVTMNAMSKIIEHITLTPFVVYRIILGAVLYLL